MNIEQKCNGGALTVYIKGDFGADCIPEAEGFLKENLSAVKDGVNRIEIDLGEVGRFAKEALLLLLGTKKKLDGKMKVSIVNVGEELYEKLDGQGVTTLLEVKRKAE